MKSPAWGLTGGIASGKSTVAKLFRDLGFRVIDADQRVRELSAPGGAAFSPIVKRFGALNTAADKKALRELVFNDARARSELEAILHPLLADSVEKEITALLKQNPGPIMYEAALLVETGRYRDFQGLITVSAPVNERMKRLAARSPESAPLAASIIASQLTDEAREKAADFVIRNEGGPELLEAQIRAIAEKISSPS